MEEEERDEEVGGGRINLGSSGDCNLFRGTRQKLIRVSIKRFDIEVGIRRMNNN